MAQAALARDPIAPPARRVHIARLILTDFRSYAAAEIACGGGVAILTGANGAGKTNILEAISLIGASRGLRRAQFADVTRRGAAGWAVVADIDGARGQPALRVGLGYRGGESGRSLRIDGQSAKGFEQLTRALPQLWLTPDMDRLFVDGAGGRRRFIDRFAQNLDPSLAAHAHRFEQAMRERNRVLAQETHEPAWLAGLEETMAANAVIIAHARLHALDALASASDKARHAAFPRGEISLQGALEADLRVRPVLAVEEDYRAQLAEARPRDAAAGRTLDGPHRSDLLVRYADKDMPAAACSTGEQKALLVGLVLAQAQSIAERTSDAPLLLLDEVAAHLDEDRRAVLADLLAARGGQSWITGTEARQFAAFGGDTEFFTVANNAIIGDGVAI